MSDRRAACACVDIVRQTSQVWGGERVPIDEVASCVRAFNGPVQERGRGTRYSRDLCERPATG